MREKIRNVIIKEKLVEKYQNDNNIPNDTEVSEYLQNAQTRQLEIV
jgi:hypothetical protein